MAPGRRKGSGRAAAAAAAARQQWKVGDLVLAKMKGFPAWPAMVSEPEKWGYSSDRKKLLVYFYGTKQIAFCNYADIEAFTEEKKKSLLVKRQGKGADFVRAVDEIIDIYESLKKQKLCETNSVDEDIQSNAENLGGFGSKSFRKSPEISSHITNNHQSEEANHASVESQDVVSSERILATNVEGDFHNASTLGKDPIEQVSILDQLRQTPFSTATTTRKRLRDGSAQNSVIQKMPSLRRSRSSSGGDPHKIQKLTMMNGADLSKKDLAPVVVQEDTSSRKLTGEVAHVSIYCDGMTPVSAGSPSNLSSEDIVSEMVATRCELEEGNALEPSCRLECSANGSKYKNPQMNGGDKLNDKLELPIKTVIVKKKRKQNRKRAANTRECAAYDKEEDLQAEFNRSLSECPNSHSEIIENGSKADGDEHLPLVKRARVRMGKPSVEERQLDEFVGKKEISETNTAIDKPDKCHASSSPLNSSPAGRTSLGVKEVPDSSHINDCTHSGGMDVMFWKVNKYQLTGIRSDVEAALPPSKRLHRALEAMSANAAEAPRDSPDTPEAPGEIENISNDCTDSPNTNSIPLSANGNVRSPLGTLQSSDSTAFHKSASGLSSTLTSQVLEMPTLTSSEVEPDGTPIGNLRSPRNEDCKEVLLDVKDCDGLSNSIIACKDMHESILQQPFSSESVSKQNASCHEGVRDQLPIPLEDKNGTLQQTEEHPYPTENIIGQNGTMRSIAKKPDHPLKIKEDSDFLHPSGSSVILSVTNGGFAASNTSGATKSSSSLSDESTQTRDMQDVTKEVIHRVTPKDWGTPSDLTPMKDLIAAAQAKRFFSRCTSFLDSNVDSKVVADAVVSPLLTDRDGFSVRASHPTSMIYHRPASDDRTHYLQNGSKSPFVSQREKGFNKSSIFEEANAARRSFETLLCTLSRTKESIGRATRVAIDCAKYGIAGEVIEILIQYLEKESSLYKRVDLFFLVDSITQCSRSQKGVAGDVYLSLLQTMLPRLLSAAAPPGNVAWENRRQCLKVLRLWLERKTLPESIVRHHIRELESLNEGSMTNSYSRRPPRTERALNDPLREMEGMLVDEYGSNTSFHLPNFLHSRVLEDEEGSADDEKSFEAVTPEQDTVVNDENEIAQNSTEKHHHILEDVDGELEMEDVAPSCAGELNSKCHSTGADTVCNAYYHLEERQSVPFAPPLPDDLPPSPPPLPSSPPPLAPSCSTLLCVASQQQLVGSEAHIDVTDFQPSGVCHSVQNQQPQSIHSNNLQGNLMLPESVSYYPHGYGGHQKEIPPSLSSLSSSGSYENLVGSHPPLKSGNNVQPPGNTPLPNKAYHLQPPPPSVSNQFSYVQAESQQRVQSWGGCSSFNGRFQYTHDSHIGNYFGDGGTRGHHEIAERGRFSSAVRTDRPEPLSGSHPPYGATLEPSRNSCHEWPLPPRTSSYSVSAPRPSLENPISRVAGAPVYWRPR